MAKTYLGDQLVASYAASWNAVSPAGAGAGTEVGNKASQAVHRAGLCFIEINFIGWLYEGWKDVGWMNGWRKRK